MTEEGWNAAALPSPGGSPTQPTTAPAAVLDPTYFHPDGRPRSNGQTHKKRKSKARRLREEKAQTDGAVSDSVLPSMASPQAKPRQQSVALPVPQVHAINKTAQRQRPVSVGGNMLPATPLKEQAYAGPTFQASPAASALPMPKFFSKSVPNVAKHAASLDARMAGQKTPDQQSSPEPDVVSPQPPPRSAQQSPLDLFFNAQKAENQRKASMQSPEAKARQAVPMTEPRNPFQPISKSVFLHELDGDSDAMPSPKTVPPVNANRDEYTQKLKDLLFNGSNGLASPNATTPPPAQRSSSSLQSPGLLSTPSPTQRSSSGPSTPTPSAEQPNHYSLHYGNRNLSPLFKASRGDPPSRPSNLRQHSAASDASPTAPSPQPPQIDPNTFSRNYLNQHIRSSPSASMPNVPGINGYSRQQSYRPTSQHGTPSASGSAASPRAGSNTARDIRSMEDDLRPCTGRPSAPAPTTSSTSPTAITPASAEAPSAAITPMPASVTAVMTTAAAITAEAEDADVHCR